MFKSFGPLEIGLILAVVLLIFGAGKLPQVGGALGKSIREFRKSVREGDGEEKEGSKTSAQTAKSEETQKS
jgi:sec-independent protein translocase protein TatA